MSGDGEPLWFITARFFHEVYEDKGKLRRENTAYRAVLKKIVEVTGTSTEANLMARTVLKETK